MNKILFIILLFFTTNICADGYDVFSIGYYDIKFDGSATNDAVDLRYERRFDYNLIPVGPKQEVFFNLKPFVGIEFTSDSASYLLGGIYLEDNLGTLITGDESNFILTPSFGVGMYDDGDGKKLGSSTEFRTTIELSYQFESKNRIGLSFGHISNAELGGKNPGVEIISISYQVPY